MLGVSKVCIGLFVYVILYLYLSLSLSLPLSLSLSIYLSISLPLYFSLSLSSFSLVLSLSLFSLFEGTPAPRLLPSRAAVERLTKVMSFRSPLSHLGRINPGSS